MLRTAVDAFDGCALRATSSGRAVFAHLPPHVDVVVVAEAPGPEDDAAGAPFSGPAGALVRTLLRHAGLEDRAPSHPDRLLATAGRGRALFRGSSGVPALP